MTTLALDSDFGSSLREGVWAILLYAIVGLALIVVGFYAVDFTTPGKLRELVRAGKPNATYITSAGMLSMAFIVVIAIYASGGKLLEGLIYTIVFGLVGIAAQVVSVRILDVITGVELDELMNADHFAPQARVIAAGHVALGLVVAVAVL